MNVNPPAKTKKIGTDIQRSKRDKINANSALLVTVNETDFGSDHPLAGIKFQREIEKKEKEIE